MSAKHTPGPWVIDHETRPAEVCTVHHTSHPNGFVYVRGALGYWDASDEENMANACLIAAAPELLGNLLAAANYIDTLGGDSKSYRATIAKATGSAS